MHLFHPHFRRDRGVILNQRLARKQTGGVAFLPDAAMDHVEVWQPAGGKVEMTTDLIAVETRGLLGLQLRLDAVNVRGRELSRVQPVVEGQLEIALRVGGRDAALIHPEQVHAIPGEGHVGKILEHRLRRGTAGDGQSRGAPLQDCGFETLENVFRACLSGQHRLREPMDFATLAHRTGICCTRAGGGGPKVLAYCKRSRGKIESLPRDFPQLFSWPTPESSLCLKTCSSPSKSMSPRNERGCPW